MSELVLALALDAQPVAKAEMSMETQVLLSAMNFLQFAIWGAWWVVLGNYLNAIGFSRKDIGAIYSTQPWGALLASLFIGMLADRLLPAQQVLGGSHLVGSALLFALARIRTPRAFFWTAFVYALCYAPTLSLSNAIVFEHSTSAVDDFPVIRVFGTVGWIAAGLALWFVVRPGEPMNNRPILLAAFLSLLLGVFSFFLPNTPPKGPEAFADKLGQLKDVLLKPPVLEALALLQEPRFAIFFGVSFIITIALAFYYSFTPLFLEKGVNVNAKDVGPLMSIGQWCEIGFMLTLSFFIKSLGIETVLMLGMLAWGLRFALFSLQRPFLLILLGIALHGICFDFFFASGFIYVEQTAPAAIRASGQALFGALTYGLGMLLGSYASGWLNQMYTRTTVVPETGERVATTDWRRFWMVPMAGAFICLAAYYSLNNFLAAEERARQKASPTVTSRAPKLDSATMPTSSK